MSTRDKKALLNTCAKAINEAASALKQVSPKFLSPGYSAADDRLILRWLIVEYSFTRTNIYREFADKGAAIKECERAISVARYSRSKGLAEYAKKCQEYL